MAVTVWKDILHPGTYRLEDGRVVTYTPKDIREGFRNGNAMLKAKLRMPFCWDHQPNAQPTYDLGPNERMENLSRNYFGEPSAFRLGSDGSLEALLTIDDDDDAKQMARVKTVSPRLLFDWIDEQGVKWPGLSVAHIAATPRPIQRNQRPIDLGMHLRALPQDDPKRYRDTHYLGHATRIEGGKMADENDDTGGSGTGDGAGMKSILDSLASLGITLPDGAVTDLATLDLALKVAASVKNGSATLDDDDDALDDDDSPNPGGSGATETGGSMPAVMMSHGNRAAKIVGDELTHRVKKLFRTGRIDGPTREKLLGKLKAANLSHESFDSKGNLKQLPVVAQIEAYEELPAGKFGGKRGAADSDDLSHTTTAERPQMTDPAAAGKDQPGVKEATDFLCKNLPAKK